LLVGPPPMAELHENLVKVFGSLPGNARVAALAIDPYEKLVNRASIPNASAITYNDMLSAVAEKYGVKVISPEDHIFSEDERLFTGHFHRVVYWRLAQGILRWALGAA